MGRSRKIGLKGGRKLGVPKLETGTAPSLGFSPAQDNFNNLRSRGGLKRCPQIIWYPSFQRVEATASPSAGCRLLTHIWWIECGRRGAGRLPGRTCVWLCCIWDRLIYGGPAATLWRCWGRTMGMLQDQGRRPPSGSCERTTLYVDLPPQLGLRMTAASAHVFPTAWWSLAAPGQSRFKALPDAQLEIVI